MIITTEMARSAKVDKRDLWATPEHIYQKLHREFGFTLDPCCEIATAKCPKFYTPLEDGLVQDWANDVCFVNPPYSRWNIDLWVEKCFLESQKPNTVVVGLLPVSASAHWWHNWLVGKCELRYVERRIRFVGAPYTAPFSSVIAVFGSSGTTSFSQ